MENMNISYKKWVATFVIVLVVIIGAVLAGHYISTKNKEAAQNTNIPAPLTVVKKSLDTKQVPDNIPQDLPKVAADQIFQNYIATTQDGRVQGTRTYTTSNSLADEYSQFQDYFSKNGWNVISKLDQPTLKSISAVKGATQLQVNISQNSVSKVNTVNINATQAQ